jgi:WXG100 family type VII secretion target
MTRVVSHPSTRDQGVGDRHEKAGDIRMADQTTRAAAGALAHGASRFTDSKESLHATLSQLMNELSALSSGWGGRGFVAFESTKEEFARNMRALNEVLQETATAIRTSGDHYTATDDDAASRVTHAGGNYSLPL